MSRARLRTLALVVCVSLIASACVRRSGMRTVGRREQRQLLQQASRELACRGDALVLTPLSDRVMQVHGCGQLRDYAWAPLGRRGRWAPLQPVVLRAAAEMGCAPQQVRIEAPSATVRNAAGCGRTARYDLVCGGIDCAWMMTAQGAGWGGAAVASVAPSPSIASASTTTPDAIDVPPPPGAEPAAPPAAAPPVATPITPVAADDGLVIPEPPAQGSAEAMLRAMLDQRRAEIHRCAGVGVVPVRASWDEVGAVSLALEPPLAGSPAEACIRSSVVAPPVPSGGAAGAIVHPVL